MRTTRRGKKRTEKTTKVSSFGRHASDIYIQIQIFQFTISLKTYNICWPSSQLAQSTIPEMTIHNTMPWVTEFRVYVMPVDGSKFRLWYHSIRVDTRFYFIIYMTWAPEPPLWQCQLALTVLTLTDIPKLWRILNSQPILWLKFIV